MKLPMALDSALLIEMDSIKKKKYFLKIKSLSINGWNISSSIMECPFNKNMLLDKK